MFLIPSAIKTTSRNQTDQKQTKPTKPAINTLKNQGHDLFKIYLHDDLSVHKPITDFCLKQWCQEVFRRMLCITDSQEQAEPGGLMNGADVEIDEDLL